MGGVWTKNYEGYKAACVLGFSRDGWASIKNTSGAQIGSIAFNSFSPVNPAANHYRFPLGTGLNVVPASTDVNLSVTAHLDNVGITRSDITYDDTTRTATRTYKRTVRNSSATPVTITEYGVIWSANDSSSTSSYDVLMYHGTFDTPITLNQYDTAVFEITLSVTLDELV